MKVFLYGSHAKGTAEKWSDIDLALVSPDFSEDLFEERIRLMKLGLLAASSAILDRLLHRGHLLKFEGKSYRLKVAASRLSGSKPKNRDEKGKNMELSSED